MTAAEFATMQMFDTIDRLRDRVKIKGMVGTTFKDGPNGGRVWIVQERPVLYASPLFVVKKLDGSEEAYWFFVDL